MSDTVHGAYEAPATIQRMMFATWALLYSLSPEQRAAAVLPMDDATRFDWDFIPKPDRSGIPFSALDAHQRTLAHTLLAAGCSQRGYSQTLAVMAMENILREIERPSHDVLSGDFRNPDQYFFSFWGRPGFEDTWAWRLLGHHVSLSYTIIGGRYLSTTPCNLGAQPVVGGVLRPLHDEETTAYELLCSLDDGQRAIAVIHDVAPADYVTRQVPRIGSFELPDYYDLGIEAYQITEDDRQALAFYRDKPSGISSRDLSAAQAGLLDRVVDAYLSRMPAEVADRQRASIGRAGAQGISFCWAGKQRLDGSHYYRVQTDRLLIEFDNAIDEGNHIHSVWRDLDQDLGHSLLEHYRRSSARDHLRTRLESSDAESRDRSPDVDREAGPTA